MKRSRRISSSRRRNRRDDNDFKVEPKMDQASSIDFVSSLNPSSTNVANTYQYGSDDVDYSFDSGSSWRIPATLVSIWTIILILLVFLFIIKKTVYAKLNIRPPDQRRQLDTNVENEWMFASYRGNNDDENVEVPLSTDISRDVIPSRS